jgi:hypothetical protein
VKSTDQEKLESLPTPVPAASLRGSEVEHAVRQGSLTPSAGLATRLSSLSDQSAFLSHSGTSPTLSQQLMRRLQRQKGNRYVQQVIARSNMSAESAETGQDVEQSVQAARGSGQALDAGLRRQVEPLYGADFSSVRIHTGKEADGLNRAVSARAFTVGQDIFFRESEYNPGSSQGRELLAHELTHVVQQGSGKLMAKLAVSSPGDSYEQEADQVAAQITQKLNRPDGPTAGQEMKTAPAGAQLQTKPNGKEDDSVTDALIGGALGFAAFGVPGALLGGFLGYQMGKSSTPAKKTVTLTHTKVFGSTNSIDTAITFANTKVFNQANVELVKGKEVTLDEADSKKIVGDDLILDEFVDPTKPTAEEQALLKVNQAAGAISAYYVKDFSSGTTTGESFIPSNGVGVGVAVGNKGIDQTFAHELGHVLLDEGGHVVPDNTYLMDPTVGAAKTKLTPAQITKIRSSPFAK